jgi:hypothetical protein
MTQKNNNDTIVNEKARRKILKTIAGASGAIVAGGMLPDKWSRPMVDAALLPAHAQTSFCTEPCTLNIEIEWYTAIDGDLLLETPGGTMIDPKATTQSQCLQHDGDRYDGDGGEGDDQIETISTIGTGVNPGTYRLYFRNDRSTAVDWTITGCNLDISDGMTIGTGETTLLETFTVQPVPGP